MAARRRRCSWCSAAAVAWCPTPLRGPAPRWASERAGVWRWAPGRPLPAWRAAGFGSRRRGGGLGLADPQKLAQLRRFGLQGPETLLVLGPLGLHLGHELVLALGLGIGGGFRGRLLVAGRLELGPPLRHLLAGPLGRVTGLARLVGQLGDPGLLLLDRVDPLALHLVQVPGVEARHQLLVGRRALAVRAVHGSPLAEPDVPGHRGGPQLASPAVQLGGGSPQILSKGIAPENRSGRGRRGCVEVALDSG